MKRGLIAGHHWLLVLMLAGSAPGCGPQEEPSPVPAPFPTQGPGSQEETQEPSDRAPSQSKALQSSPTDEPSIRGRSVNGLSVNGLSVNGLSVNGLSVNGLSVNGLSTAEFKQWFDQNPTLHDVVMRYVVLCAMTPTQSLTYTSLATGTQYTWKGQLGLTPDWAGGMPAVVREQQLVSACLAAHANKYGKNIPISVRGMNAKGSEIPYDNEELSTFSEDEACFFGNLFTSNGLYACNAGNKLNEQTSTARACGLASQPQDALCPPIRHLGSCSSNCTKDASRSYYVECSHNGVRYSALSTRIRRSELYTCGDGVCQFTESCGSGSQYYNCKQDCGVCP